MALGVGGRGPARGNRERQFGRTLIVVVGLVVGGILLIVLIGALMDAGVNDAEKESKKLAEIRIQTGRDVCYLITLTGGSQATGGGLGQDHQDGCGSATYPLGAGLGRNAIVSKRSGRGSLTAVLVVDGEEKSRQTTNAESPAVTLSP